MSNAVLQKLSKSSGVSVTLLERYWRDAVEEAKAMFGAELDDHGRAYVVSEVRRRALGAGKG